MPIQLPQIAFEWLLMILWSWPWPWRMKRLVEWMAMHMFGIEMAMHMFGIELAMLVLLVFQRLKEVLKTGAVPVVAVFAERTCTSGVLIVVKTQIANIFSRPLLQPLPHGSHPGAA